MSLATYKEDWARTEYIEPLFGALGWERINPANLTNRSNGYVREIPLDSPTASGVPDYGFYVDGIRVLYVEAKKPFVNIKKDERPAFQIRDYAWSAKDPIGVVTDFEEFAVYNCRVQPLPQDKPNVGLVKYLRYDEYQPEWNWLLQTFSPEAIRSGALDELAKDYKHKKLLVPVDRAFLGEIQDWRRTLAADLAARNNLSDAELNQSVQAIINRIVFLRIAEARGLESPGTLRSTIEGEGAYSKLLELFLGADTRYNSGLFHFSEEANRSAPDSLSLNLVVGDEALGSIVGRLTSERSPYRFEVIDTDILGQVYEQFLGYVVTSTPEGVTLDVKPELRKSGGVFYTPSMISRQIVAQTLGPLTDGARLSDVAKLRIVDPSCGSGSFLLAAYQYLIEWHEERYRGYRRDQDRLKYMVQGVDGKWRLRLAERKRILLANIFGVDIDPQAVEVAKLSLLLKVIEGETQIAFAVERLLPDLDANIRCGNALVGFDLYDTEQLALIADDEAPDDVNAFDWSSAFPGALAEDGFDAVVGNPPWLMAGYYVADSMPYFRRKYEVCSGKADLYYLFIEKAMRLVGDDGRVGMIVPSKLFHTSAATELRRLLTNGHWLESVVDFGTSRLFDKATNYSAILQLKKGSGGEVGFEKVDTGTGVVESYAVRRSHLGARPWHFHPSKLLDFWDDLSSRGVPLGDLVEHFGNGVQTGADPLLILSSSSAKRLGIEPDLLRPILKGKSVRRWSAIPTNLVFFPYAEESGEFVVLDEEGLSRYPGGYAYCKLHETRLRKRLWFGQSAEDLSGQWWGHMYLDHRKWFERAHFVSPSLSDVSNFAPSTDALFVTGTAGVGSVVPKDPNPQMSDFLMTVLNSSLLSSFIVNHSTPYQGNYWKFSRKYIDRAPIVLPNLKTRKGQNMFEQLAKLGQISGKLAAKAPNPTDSRKLAMIQVRIDTLVRELYGVTAAEASLVAHGRS